MTTTAAPAAGAVATQHPRLDALPMLTLYLVSLYAFPSGSSIEAISAVGRPSNIVGLACLAWWLLQLLLRSRPEERRHQPVQVALTAFVLSILVSYALANTHAIPVLERSTSDSALIRLASWIGPAILVTDGIRDAPRLLTLLRRIAFAGAAMATLGLFQYATGRSWVDQIQLPGFSIQTATLEDRAGFTRSVGTTLHALEYSTVLGAALPLALNAALLIHRTGVVRRWYGSVAIVLASLVTVSRSAIIGAATGLLILVPTWPKHLRRRAAVAGVMLLAVVYVAIPGLIGTLRGMFMGNDSSTDSRIESWGTAFAIASRYPVFGRGFGTFLPSYRILDNGYLGMLIELGAVGLAAFLALIVTALVSAFVASRRASDPALRNQAMALVAALSAVSLLVAFFDVFAFTQAVGTLFLLIGCCGAALNVARTSPVLPVGTASPARRPSAQATGPSTGANT